MALLLEKGADASQRSVCLVSLCAALRCFCPRLVEYFFLQESGSTPLMEAVISQASLTAIELLLINGADSNV